MRKPYKDCLRDISGDDSGLVTTEKMAPGGPLRKNRYQQVVSSEDITLFCCLVFLIVRAKVKVNLSELRALVKTLKVEFLISHSQALALVRVAKDLTSRKDSGTDIAAQIRALYDIGQRQELIIQSLRIANSDGELQEEESKMVTEIGFKLGFLPHQIRSIKRKVA